MKINFYLMLSLFCFACLPTNNNGRRIHSGTRCSVDNPCTGDYVCLDSGYCGECDSTHACTDPDKPACSNDYCVECTDAKQEICIEQGKVCGFKNICVLNKQESCKTDLDCTNESLTKCEPTSKVCVQCYNDGHCTPNTCNTSSFLCNVGTSLIWLGATCNKTEYPNEMNAQCFYGPANASSHYDCKCETGHDSTNRFVILGGKNCSTSKATGAKENNFRCKKGLYCVGSPQKCQTQQCLTDFDCDNYDPTKPYCLYTSKECSENECLIPGDCPNQTCYGGQTVDCIYEGNITYKVCSCSY